MNGENTCLPPNCSNASSQDFSSLRSKGLYASIASSNGFNTCCSKRGSKPSDVLNCFINSVAVSAIFFASDGFFSAHSNFSIISARSVRTGT
ncbi:hypothetical protein ACHAXM_009011 [Skeletonema potamos]